MSKERLIEFFNNENIASTILRKEIADNFTFKLISKNQFQLAAGKICDEYLFLEKGYMRAFVYDTKGKEVTTGFYASEQVVFEVSSFFNRNRSKENIQALIDCEGWYISHQQLNHLFHTIPEFREFGRAVLVKGFSALKTRMLSTITETADERYAALLKTNPEIFQHTPLKHIASYLGITDTSLSRIRKELSKK